MFFNRCAALRSAILFLGSCLGSRLYPGRGRSELEQTRHNLQDPGLSATARGQLFKGKNVNKIKTICKGFAFKPERNSNHLKNVASWDRSHDLQMTRKAS